MKTTLLFFKMSSRSLDMNKSSSCNYHLKFKILGKQILKTSNFK